MESLFDQIRRHEGFRRFPYKDTVGKLTIGYGRNIEDVGISEREAGWLLREDIHRAREALFMSLPWAKELTHDRCNVLINMAFNMGIGGLLTFKKMLRAVRFAEWEQAATEMLDSKWARQVGERAVELANQMAGLKVPTSDDGVGPI